MKLSSSQIKENIEIKTMNKFKAGNKVVCNADVKFMYGEKPHVKGGIYEVTKETEAYYNVCHKNYDLVKE